MEINDEQLHRQDYFALKKPENPFAYPDLVEPDQHKPYQHLRDMTDPAKFNEIPKPLWYGVENLITKHLDTFTLIFWSTPTKFDLMCRLSI